MTAVAYGLRYKRLDLGKPFMFCSCNNEVPSVEAEKGYIIEKVESNECYRDHRNAVQILAFLKVLPPAIWGRHF